MYSAKNNKYKQTIFLLMVGLLVFIPIRPMPVFVTVHAIAAVLLLAALPVFYAGLKKKSQHKTQSLPIFCAPARLARLRGCHGFCPQGLTPRIPKNPASPLRKRSAAQPTAYGWPLGTPGKPDAQRGAAVVSGSTSSATCLQAYPLFPAIAGSWPTLICGLRNKKIRPWHCPTLLPYTCNARHVFLLLHGRKSFYCFGLFGFCGFVLELTFYRHGIVTVLYMGNLSDFWAKFAKMSYLRLNRL